MASMSTPIQLSLVGKDSYHLQYGTNGLLLGKVVSYFPSHQMENNDCSIPFLRIRSVNQRARAVVDVRMQSVEEVNDLSLHFGMFFVPLLDFDQYPLRKYEREQSLHVVMTKTATYKFDQINGQFESVVHAIWEQPRPAPVLAFEVRPVPAIVLPPERHPVPAILPPNLTLDHI